MDAADERGPARGRRPGHRLRPAFGRQDARRSPGWRASTAPSSTLRSGATTSSSRASARGRRRDRLQRDPGGSGDPADGRGSSTSTSARPDGPCRRWTSPTASAPSGCSSAFRCCSGSTGGGLRVHGARRRGNDQPALAAARRSARSPAGRSTGRSRIPSFARKVTPARRDRLQAADAHRRVVSDADEAERRADHRPDRRGDAGRGATAGRHASVRPTCSCWRPASRPTGSSRRWRSSAAAGARWPRSGPRSRAPTWE